MFLYCIRNKINGKEYIGITTKSVNGRFLCHIKEAKYRGRNVLHKALRKYGAAAFDVSALVEHDSWKVLQQLERNAISEHGTLVPNGYNMTEGGEGTLGYTMPIEARRKISVALKVRLQNNPAAKARALKNLERTPERRAALAEHMQNLWKDDQWRAARKPARKARPWSEAARKRQSAKMSSPDISSGISRRITTRWENPTSRATLIGGLRKAWADPEIRAKRIAAMKAAAAARKQVAVR